MRGPKPRTPENRRDARPIALGEDVPEPPVKLRRAANAEYVRLIGVLREFGSLEVIDLMVVANAARTKALLDKAYADLGDGVERLKIRSVNILTTQHRGLMRELGLTTSPNRASFRPKPQGSNRDQKQDDWANRLKVS